MQIYMKTIFVYNGMKINRFGKIQRLHQLRMTLQAHSIRQMLTFPNTLKPKTQQQFMTRIKHPYAALMLAQKIILLHLVKTHMQQKTLLLSVMAQALLLAAMVLAVLLLVTKRMPAIKEPLWAPMLSVVAKVLLLQVLIQIPEACILLLQALILLLTVMKRLIKHLVEA